MPEVDLNTFPGITEAVSNHGGLRSIIRFYDVKSGNIFKAVAVYPCNEGQHDFGTIIDIEEVPLGEPDA